MTYQLSERQKLAYREQGFLSGLPCIFEGKELENLKNGYQQLTALLKPEETALNMIRWHMSSRWLYDVCMNARILDLVEGLLGKNFYLWGSSFFAKAPHSPSIVPWHQDAYYWPLHPHRTVTAWLAIGDVDEANGAMKVVPGTHKSGLITHNSTDAKDSALSLEINSDQFDVNAAQSIILKAGHISLHDDAIVHGSPGNSSDCWRIGLVMRYSSTEVKCNTAVWPDFLTFQARGFDEYNHNPKGEIPQVEFARPKTSIQVGGVNLNTNNNSSSEYKGG